MAALHRLWLGGEEVTCRKSGTGKHSWFEFIGKIMCWYCGEVLDKWAVCHPVACTTGR